MILGDKESKWRIIFRFILSAIIFLLAVCFGILSIEYNFGLAVYRLARFNGPDLTMPVAMTVTQGIRQSAVLIATHASIFMFLILGKREPRVFVYFIQVLTKIISIAFLILVGGIVLIHIESQMDYESIFRWISLKDCLHSMAKGIVFSLFIAIIASLDRKSLWRRAILTIIMWVASIFLNATIDALRIGAF